MKTFVPLSLTLISLIFTAPCANAMMDIEILTKARVEQLGLVLQVTPAGPDAACISLEFNNLSELKDVSHVNLEITQDGKLLTSAPLQSNTPAPCHVKVTFVTARAQIPNITLRIVTGSPMVYTGHDLNLKDFIDHTTIKLK